MAVTFRVRIHCLSCERERVVRPKITEKIASYLIWKKVMTKITDENCTIACTKLALHPCHVAIAGRLQSESEKIFSFVFR